MLTNHPETDFDKLLNAAKQKAFRSSTPNIKFHRQPSRPDQISVGAHISPDASAPFSVNYTHFLRRPDANDSHELADSKFIIPPSPAAPNPSPGHKQIESLGNKRWKYQGKTYKEEPIGRS